MPSSAAAMASQKRKRKSQKNQASTMPLLPPEVALDDIHVSDDDIKYVAKHRKYAGFLSNLNTATITKQVLGLKPGKKQDINLETYYEKKSKRVSSFKEEHVQANMVDPADALPVKTLSGELHYRTMQLKSLPENEDLKDMSMSMDERKALIRKHADVSSQQSEKSISDSGNVKKLSKSDRRKERKLAKKDKEVAYSVAESLVHTSPEGSRVSALEELQNDISEEERVEELKARMAELGTAVLADPEDNIESLIELQGLCTDKNANIAKMAMLSSLVLFRDIVPGYRIRLPTAKELEMQVSKEIKKLRDFETKLLKCYQKYVQVLLKSLKSDVHKRTAARCVSGLIEAIPHFNFRDSLMANLIPLMDSPDSDCRKMSCDAVRSLFQNEGKHGGLATVEAVEMIADFVKTGECLLRPDVVEVLLTLSFDEDLRKPSSENQKAKQTGGSSEMLNPKNQRKEKKMKKRELEAKLREEVVADFRESSALSDPSERRKLQTQTLTAVFETYFRILKSSLDPTNSVQDTNLPAMRFKLADYGPRPLLRPCLDGLAKFSYLVSVDFMGDLLAILKRLAASSAEPIAGQNAVPLTFIDRLHCCVVAFKIVRSNLDALNIDLRDFYVTLYNILLCHDLVSEEHGGLVLAEALQVMLWDSRQHDMQRVSAFVKRLSTKSLHIGPAEAMVGLVTVRHLLQRYKKCCNLLENDEGGGSIGGNVAVFHAEGNDPDLSGALSTVLWEVSLLSKHYHPDIAKLASQISKMGSDSNDFILSTLSPKDAVLQYSTKGGGFRPTVQLPRKLTRRKAYSSSLPLSKSICDMSNIESDKIVTEIASPNIFSSHFKVLRDFKQNETLRKELRQVTRSIELYKSFRAKGKKRKNRNKQDCNGR